jgi:hypothetical protein
MRTSVSESKSRQKLAAENMSEAQRVHHQLRSGPIRSELRNAREAIQIAGAFYRQAAEQMKARKLDPKDLFVHISYLSPDLTVLSTLAFEPGKESQLYEKLSTGCSIMAGLIYAIRDAERGSILVGAKPFVDTPLVREALKQRVEASGIGVS